jgi:hypothetical protein
MGPIVHGSCRVKMAKLYASPIAPECLAIIAHAHGCIWDGHIWIQSLRTTFVPSLKFHDTYQHMIVLSNIEGTICGEVET